MRYTRIVCTPPQSELGEDWITEVNVPERERDLSFEFEVSCVCRSTI